jgi:hypothetical protein
VGEEERARKTRRAQVRGIRRAEQEAAARMTQQYATAKARLREWRKEQATQVRDGLLTEVDPDDIDKRYREVCRLMKRGGGRPCTTSFRRGDAPDGEIISHPPSAVLEEGGRIMDQVARSMKRPISLNAVKAWAEVFVPRFEPARSPDGGIWLAHEQFSVWRLQRCWRRSRRKAIGLDQAQAELWEEAPGWVRDLLVSAMREIAQRKVVPPAWLRLVFILLDKKTISELVSKKREVAIASQNLKAFEGAAVQPAFEAVEANAHTAQFGFG